uniref:Ribonuclease H protein At1g65750 family n=2 Tax=Cajanus cajan TaxID=3821 RepID=A0A151QUL4_CAJCA|nr:Putative ribonuclease H protein At1g65750 family [Cajanus cajan]
MTNQVRVDRGLGIDPTCPVCMQETESNFHALRDCKFAAEIWSRTSGGSLPRSFAEDNIHDWVHANLKERRPSHVNWPILFAVTLDSLWIRRNKMVFDNSFSSSEQVVKEINARVTTIVSIHTNNSFLSDPLCGHQDTHWRFPPIGHIKLNGDGAVSNDGIGACGGVVRDSSGNFLLAFSKKLGCISILKAELWAIYQGLLIIKDRYSRSLIICESDSAEAVKLIEEGCARHHPCFGLTQQIQELSLYFSSFLCIHIPREANIVADRLAKHSFWIEEELAVFFSSPSFLHSLLSANLVGAA